MSILERINGHDDLVRLTSSEQKQLCEEIRRFLVSSIAKTGGHLASNLGTVELSVAIETVFDTNIDRLVFDVGHQSYVHKLLTGRRAGFDNLRQFGGMAGFPKPSESNTDSFVAGHASSSVSIALGMARARSLQKKDYHVITVIGDGATTGGMAYEGMNDAAVSKEPLIVILNDNRMSIDHNVGGVARHLSRLRMKRQYLGFKRMFVRFTSRIPGGETVFRIARNVKEWMKRSLLPTTIFENMGFSYVGPVDGHDLPNLISLLEMAKDMKEPVLLHVITKKGKGYAPAEEEPSRFHGIGRFDPETGESSKTAPSFSGTFGDAMIELAAENDAVCAITAAMPGGTGLLGFKEAFPRRLFDVGIAEEHAVSMAGGLAKQGMVPVVAIYSTFLQRAYDMIFQDVAMLNLHVVFAIDRAGLVGEDGETHHGIYDIGFLRQVPGMRILCPASRRELRDMLRWAVLNFDGPVAIRYPRGSDTYLTESKWPAEYDENRSVCCHHAGEDITLITYGTILKNVMDAAETLKTQGVHAQVLRLLEIEPLPVDSLLEHLSANRKAIVVEETAKGSGISEALAFLLSRSGNKCQVYSMDLGKRFVTHGNVELLYHEYGLDADSIAKKALEVLKVEN